ncbi:26589_t:CDS:2, partial [Racocetra persica]
GTKVDLIAKLKNYWKDSDKKYNNRQKGKSKLVETDIENNRDDEFLSFMKNKLEEKIKSKLESSLASILNRSLQCWASQYKNFQDKLSKAIQEESIEKVQEAYNVLKIRVFILRTAEDKRWRVASNIPKPVSTVKDELYNMLIEARKQAKPKKYKPFQGFGGRYSKGEYIMKGTSAQYFALYSSVQKTWSNRFEQHPYQEGLN